MSIPTFSARPLPCATFFRATSALCRINLGLLARSLLLLLLLSLYTQARTPSLGSRRSRTVHHNCCKRRARDYHGHRFARFFNPVRSGGVNGAVVWSEWWSRLLRVGRLLGVGAQCAHRLNWCVWRVPERLRVWSRGVGSNDVRLVFGRGCEGGACRLVMRVEKVRAK